MVFQWDKNPEISVSSRNDPEMSQPSSDLPMLVNFSIYILISHRDPLKSETFNKSQLSQTIDVPAGWFSYLCTRLCNCICGFL